MMEWRVIFAGALAMPVLTGCGTDRLVMLSESLEPVLGAFNADRGKPRVVALFSPT